jgi:hypothetical protein
MCSFAATADGDRLLTAGLDGVVKVWRIADCNQPTRQWFNGHSEGISGLAFSPDSRLVASSGLDGKIRVYECATGRPVDTLDLAPQGYKAYWLAFADGEKLFAIASSHPTGSGLVVWQPGSSTPYRFHPVSELCDISITPDGTRLALAISREGMAVWDTAREEAIHTFSDPRMDVRYAQIAPDGRTLALVTVEPRGLHLMDLVTGVVRRVPESNLNIDELAFDPASRKLAVAGSFDAVHVIDVQAGRFIDAHYLNASFLVSTGLCFSPDGQVMAAAFYRPDGVHGQVMVWDLNSRRILLTLEPYHLGARNLRYSNDGRYLATLTSSPDNDGNAGIFLWRFDPPRGPRPAVIEGGKISE